MAAKRRQGADAVPEETGAPRHLCHSVFGLFFGFSRSSTTCTVCSDGSPSLDALLWAPTAAQALAVLGTGAGWADAGGVVCGGAGDGNLTGTVSSCHWFIILQTSQNIFIVIILKPHCPAPCATGPEQKKHHLKVMVYKESQEHLHSFKNNCTHCQNLIVCLLYYFRDRVCV